jgi:hypothetical protein
MLTTTRKIAPTAFILGSSTRNIVSSAEPNGLSSSYTSDGVTITRITCCSRLILSRPAPWERSD